VAKKGKLSLKKIREEEAPLSKVRKEIRKVEDAGGVTQKKYKKNGNTNAIGGGLVIIKIEV